MDNQINQIFEFLKNPSLERFQQEFFAGIIILAAAAILYVVARVVFKILFRGNKRCHGINIVSDNGMLYITTNAMADLIKSMKSTFTHIDINRVDLTLRKGRYVMDLMISFDMNGGELTDQVSKLRTKIVADLKAVFGIESITQINVKLRKTSRSSAKSNSQPILTPAPAPVIEITPKPNITEKKEDTDTVHLLPKEEKNQISDKQN